MGSDSFQTILRRVGQVALFLAIPLVFAASPLFARQGQSFVSPKQKDVRQLALNTLQETTAPKDQKISPKKAGDSKNRNAQQQKKQPAPVSKERLAELKAFVNKHHAELVPLMEWLKKKRPQQYQLVLKNMDKTVQRLQAYKERDKARYEFGIEQWKVNSRIQLLSARLAMQDSPDRRKELEKLIARKVEMRTTQLEREAQALKKRLEKLTKQINDSKAKQSDEVKRQMESVIKSTEKYKKSRNNQRVKKPDPSKQEAAAKKDQPKKDQQKTKSPQKQDSKKQSEKQNEKQPGK